MFWTILLQADAPAGPLMLPDSVQKANFAQTVEKLANLDLHELLRSMLSETIWILVKIAVALAIYFVGRWIVRRILRLLDAAFERRRVDVSLRQFMRNTVSVVFSLILIMIVVQTLGVNVTSLIAVFSAATLAIGMALSGTAQNFAGGVMILLMKPYRVGDFISAQGQSGTVREIKLFSTVITTGDNQTIFIPNNSIATAIVDNYSTAELRRVDWTRPPWCGWRRWPTARSTSRPARGPATPTTGISSSRPTRSSTRRFPRAACASPSRSSTCALKKSSNDYQ